MRTGKHTTSKSIAHTTHKVGQKIAEMSLVYLDEVLKVYGEMLARVSWWNLRTNEANRNESLKDFADIERAMTALAEDISTMKGHPIFNTVYLMIDEAKTVARKLQYVCKTGDFEKYGWEDKYKMFDDIRTTATSRLNSVEAAYKTGLAKSSREEVFKDLEHHYIGPFDKQLKGFEKGARQSGGL